MATDMDIDMDIDVGITANEFVAPEIDILPDVHVSNNYTAETPILNAPDDATATEIAPNKVHIRGLDNLTTKDIRAFAAEHYPDSSAENVEWIDDTSANLVYEDEATALEALRALVVADTDISNIPLLQAIDAKSLSSHPNSSLLVRRAVISDRKKPRARESSRFYLLNPEYDPAERRRRGPGNEGRKYRDRDDGGYRSQRYDDREQQNRLREAENAGFDASLYDDDEGALAQRTARNRTDSSSDSDSRRRFVRTGRTAGKELFPERPSQNGSGRLRDRSASPIREGGQERYTMRQSAFPRKPSIAASENRLRAQMIKARLAKADPPKELFPQKGNTSFRGSGVFDVADETADLFARKMHVPFIDGSADQRTLASKTANDKWDNITGFSIKGASKASAGPGFSIKGAASGGQVKELFPAHFGDNAGKELFSGALGDRGRRRQKAEDLFH
ncbi:hypothetical protein BJ875DRAFT_220807 [Amylocarpus encephaloides]|uniref:Uncharacterized protein n=1 Tax=Amylocarpus encephaloides TaxID=45428 RepID=A0A9P8CA89_9HELO|nr:hypothetical protein BJ875DRAFT_220807 [Amylocarpus encephaloides]